MINTYKKNKNWFELPNLRQTQILWKRGEWMCMMGLNRRLWRHADIFFRAIDFNEVIFDSEYLRIFADFIITNGGGATISYIWEVSQQFSSWFQPLKSRRLESSLYLVDGFKYR